MANAEKTHISFKSIPERLTGMRPETLTTKLTLLRRLRQATTPKHSSLRGEPPKRALSLVVRPVNGLIRVPDVQDMFSNQSNMLKHCRVSPTKSSNNRVAWFFRPDSRKTTASPNHMVVMRHANSAPRTFFLRTLTLSVAPFRRHEGSSQDSNNMLGRPFALSTGTSHHFRSERVPWKFVDFMAP